MSLEALEDRTVLSLSFAPAVSLPVGLRPESIVTADLNNDGKQDIVVLNQGQFRDFQSSVSVLLGNGDGSFRPAITTGLLPGANSVAAGDFDNDGRLDLAVANRLNDVVEVLRGNGDGTFQDRVDYAVGFNPQSVAAVDLGNGQVDLVVANHDSSDVSVLLGNGDGTFQPAQNIDVKTQSFGEDSHPLTLLAGDVNGDGKPDLLVSQFVGVDAGETILTVLPGNGDGTFQAPVHTNAGVDRFGLTVADFDGDGKLDVAVEELDNFFPGAADVLLGNGDGTFGDPHVFRTGGDAGFGVAAGDFNGDGRPDLAVANTFSNDVRVLLNTSTGAAAGLLQGGFETPNVGTGSFGAFQYNPSGSAWTFSGSAGVAGNGSGFTGGNPDAPDGSQVAFLQATGSFSQTVNLAAGTYSLSFLAAQRANFQAGAQTFQVLVDGAVVGTFTPADTAYSALTTDAFTVAAGAHTIQFVGLNPQGGDNTAFVDNVQLLAR